MGCGTSSTSVQTFNDQEANKHNRNYQQENPTPSRQSGTNHHQTNAASISPHTPSRQPSATSTASKKLTARKSSANSVNSRRSSRENSAKTGNTYTIGRRNSSQSNTDVNNDSDTKAHDENQNIDTEQERDAVDEEQERQKEEARQQYEEIQKQTFLTDNSKDQQNTQKVFEPIEPETKVDKAARHEEIARVKEEKRESFNPDKNIHEAITEYNLSPLLIPEMDAEQTIGNYTVDDIVEHNSEVGSEDWFKYGRKVYSYEKLKPLFQARFAEIKDTHINPYVYKYTNADKMGHKNIVYAREFMITRAELSRMLAASHVGNCVDINREEYMARMKQSVELVLEDPGDSENMNDYKAQLSRWLADYPYSKVDNDKMDTNVDANEQPFPLPNDIKADPSVLRKWIETWEAFDLEIPEEGCWPRLTPLDVEWGDAHETFAEAVQSHDDNTLDPMDMSIDGDVAWIEIELELFKNDVTIPDQDAIWKTRADRTNLDDPEWQADRRKKLGETLKAGYENTRVRYELEKHERFAELLEEHWRIFQELCEKEFNPPPPRKVRSVEMKRESNHELSDIQENSDILDVPGADNEHHATVKDTASIRSNNSRPGSKNSVTSGSRRRASGGSMVNGSVTGLSQNGDGDLGETLKIEHDSASIRSGSRPGSKTSFASNSKRRESGGSMLNGSASGVRNGSVTELSQNGDAYLGETLKKENDTGSIRSGSRPGSKTSLASNSKRRESTQDRPGSKSSTNRRESESSVKTAPTVNGNESGRKSSDFLAIDGDGGNANGVPDRGSTTETMDSGLELDNFDNFAKS